jgi:DNA-binding transcriptional regulator YiaG
MTELGQDLVQSMNEALAIARDDADPSTDYVPADIDVRAIRRGLATTRVQLAQAYGFPVASPRDREQGRAPADTSARACLLVISRESKAAEGASRRPADLHAA